MHNTNIMAHSINTTPLLQEVDSSDNENEDITETPDDSVVVRDSKSLFKSAEPRDKYYMAYIIFYLLGMVTLLPWNFFITADDVSPPRSVPIPNSFLFLVLAVQISKCK